MKTKLFSVLALILVGVIAMSGLVSAVPVVIEQVKIDGDVMEPTITNTINNYERGEELDIRIKLVALEDIEDLEIEVEIDGYEHGDIEARTDDLFDLGAGETDRVDLSLRLPVDMDKDTYQLKVTIRAKYGPNTEETFDLRIKTPRHKLTIEDVVFSPSYSVKAGRALLATVRIENTGSKDEDGIKVKVSIPELGMEASDYIDELEEGDETSSEELYMRVPNCVEVGEYEAKVEVTFDEGYEKVTDTYMINVVDGGVCDEAPATETAGTTGKTIITVGPESQDVRKGEGGAVYPVTLTNTGTITKTYTVGVQAAPGLDVRVSPSNLVVLEGGASKAAYVYVSATEAASTGEQLFALEVKSGDETLKEVTLKANVVGEEATAGWSKVKKGLEVGLIVLVVLLVILGLVIGFNKLKGDEDEEVEAGQTYY